MARAATLLLVVAVYAIWHPYAGIIGDASLYLGRSLADLDPNGVGRDIVFANDGQSRFSVFSRLVDPLVAAFGAQRAGLYVAVAGSTCVFAATVALARALTSDRRLAIAVVLTAAVMPTGYGDAVFHFAETSAVPRPFAEAAVMATIAALLIGRPVVASLLLALALLIHPIMAMAGVGTVLVLLAWRHSMRASLAVIAAFASLAGLAALLGASGVPLFDRLLARFDPDWLGMVTVRNPHLFPSLWHAPAFAAPLAHVTTLALAARHADQIHRRVLVAVAVSAVVQLAAATLLGDVLHEVLAIQVQAWRALWLLAVVATSWLPLLAWQLWREGTRARLVLAIVGLVWLFPLGLPGTVVACAAALIVRDGRLAPPLHDRHVRWALVAVAAVVVLGTVLATIAWADFVGQAPRGASMGWYTAWRTDLVAAPAGLVLAFWLLAKPSRRSAASLTGLCAIAIGAGAVAASTWDQRAPAALAGPQDGFPAGSVPGARSSEIMVIGGLSAAWFTLGRPQYLSPQQAVSIVFSRPLAMEWRRRAEGLTRLGLAPHTLLRPRDAMSATDHIEVTAAKLAAFCARDDAPAAVIVPDRDDAPAPGVAGAAIWPAPAPLSVFEDYGPEWHAIRGWIVAPCRGSTLAKTDRR